LDDSADRVSDHVSSLNFAERLSKQTPSASWAHDMCDRKLGNVCDLCQFVEEAKFTYLQWKGDHRVKNNFIFSPSMLNFCSSRCTFIIHCTNKLEQSTRGSGMSALWKFSIPFHTSCKWEAKKLPCCNWNFKSWHSCCMTSDSYNLCSHCS